MSNTNYGDRKRLSRKDSFDRISESINRVQKGRIDVSGIFSPSNNSATTTVDHPNIGQNSYIALFPLNVESAAVVPKFAEIRASRTQRQCTISHPKFTDGSIFSFMLLVIG